MQHWPATRKARGCEDTLEARLEFIEELRRGQGGMKKGDMAAAKDVGATMPDDPGGPIPPDFICPITQEIMRDPVIALDGHSYERTAITQWFGLGRIKSPLTNAPLG